MWKMKERVDGGSMRRSLGNVEGPVGDFSVSVSVFACFVFPPGVCSHTRVAEQEVHGCIFARVVWMDSRGRDV